MRVEMTTKTLQGNGVQQVLAKVGIVKRADVQQAMDTSDWVEEGVLADAVNNLENAGLRAPGLRRHGLLTIYL